MAGTIISWGTRPIIYFATLALSIGYATNSLAQTTTTPAPTLSRVGDVPAAGYSGLPLGAWMVFPELVAGGVYDSNIYHSPTNRVSRWGGRVAPSVVATLNNGIHRTHVRGALDARFYSGVSQADTIDAEAGVRHTWDPMRDLTYQFSGDYVREVDVFSNGTVTAAGTPITNPNRANRFAGAASVQKTLNHGFAAAGMTISHTKYDNVPAGAVSRDGTTYTVTSRVGYRVTPWAFLFVEPSGDWRRFDAAAVFDSQGYRAIAGIGTDRIGLFRGEVFGGYQEQQFDNAAIGDVNSTAFGARLFYFPTRYLTVRGTADQTIGVSTQPTAVSVLGTAYKLTAAQVDADYALARYWSAGARVAYNHADYVNSARVDDAWIAGVSFTYTFWRNLGITFGYEYTTLQSNAPLVGYDKSVFSVGGRYRY